MVFLLWCFLSLPCVPGFSRVACVFFAPRPLSWVFSGVAPGFFAFSPLRRLPPPPLLLGVLSFLLFLPLLPFVLHVCGILPLRSFSSRAAFISLLLAATACPPPVFSAFSMRSVRFSCAIVLVSALLFLRAPWFLLFHGVLLLCCAFFPFLAPVFPVSFFFILGSLLFQLGVRAFEGEASHSSPLLRFISDSS